jgi:ABC-type polysaccharide/polyol phosphate transport system ATPase subunit
MAWAVEIRGVSKAFMLRHNSAQNIKVRLLGLFHPRHREQLERFWALHEIDLTVRKGECLGLIGRNGSGKSTLLRIMANIYQPTVGEVIVRGRVAPMIELGVGFQPDLTGQENIYLNTSFYGLSRHETDAIYQRIVEFSELDEFIDVPVKNYSTGMYTRLGFSIAVHLEPEILLIDEVLAVGDEQFRQKCLQRIGELRRRGTTIVLVSHQMEMIEQMCDRVCLLVRGRMEAEGDPANVVVRYREVLSAGKGASRPARSRRA